MTSPLSAGGLVLDVSGAIALASAFAFKRPKDIRAEAGSYFDFNAPLTVSLAKQTADAWAGGTLLVLGFAGQFIQSLGWDFEPRLAVTVPAASILSVFAFGALHRYLRPWNVRRTIESVLMAQRDAQRLASWKPAIIWFSRTLGREIQTGERPSELAKWLIGEKRWERLTAGINVPEDVSEPFTPG